MASGRKARKWWEPGVLGWDGWPPSGNELVERGPKGTSDGGREVLRVVG